MKMCLPKKVSFLLSIWKWNRFAINTLDKTCISKVLFTNVTKKFSYVLKIMKKSPMAIYVHNWYLEIAIYLNVQPSQFKMLCLYLLVRIVYILHLKPYLSIETAVNMRNCQMWLSMHVEINRKWRFWKCVARKVCFVY